MIKRFESFNEIPNYFEGFYEYDNKKTIIWYLNDKNHREDGPAIKCWYNNGQIFSESWYLNDKEYTR